MSDLDDFLDDVRPAVVPRPADPPEGHVGQTPVASAVDPHRDVPVPIRKVASDFKVRLEKVISWAMNLPEPEELTYACKTCLDALYLRRERNGRVSVWPCANCPPGRSIIAYHWLDVCFPYEPRFQKRVASAKGQRNFNEYLGIYPEQESWLKDRIDRIRNEDQATRNRARENPWNRE